MNDPEPNGRLLVNMNVLIYATLEKDSLHARAIKSDGNATSTPNLPPKIPGSEPALGEGKIPNRNVPKRVQTNLNVNERNRW